MDADITEAFRKITEALSALSAKVDKLIAAPPVIVPPLPPSGHVMQPADDEAWHRFADPNNPEHPFTQDYWFAGQPGAQKGVNLGLWSSAKMMMGMMSGLYSRPELYVVTLLNPQPDGGRWMDAVKSVADAGWMGDRNFEPNDAESSGEAAARWTAAGRPTTDREGFVIINGKFGFDQKGNKMKRDGENPFVVA